jgi:hypothetical protein
MLMVLLRGKLSRDQENMEDILTSNVFGVLQYLPPGAALVPFLHKVSTPEGKCPLADLPPSADASAWPGQSFVRVSTMGVPLTSVVDAEGLKSRIIEPLIQGITRTQGR